MTDRRSTELGITDDNLGDEITLMYRNTQQLILHILQRFTDMPPLVNPYQLLDMTIVLANIVETTILEVGLFRTRRRVVAEIKPCREPLLFLN